MPARLESLGIAAGLGREAVHAQAVAALDVIVHLCRDADGQRRLAELSVLDRTPGGMMAVREAFRVGAGEDVVPGPAAADLRRLVGLP